ncbi:SDR family oxidoreductase [Pseudonocardia spinosispora]|uniref:SDR family oxidoreductase n=1 Tax=Pseudonocardia spinosispora TaxID=103441 RepID=UPI000684B9F4|nr:SDR family oxidoreductase [Pseudonocardia spinosispora]
MTILVTGAAGASGAAIIREFSRRELPVRALVRNPVAAPSTGNVEVVTGDMSRPDTLGEALDGVEKVLMISTANQSLVQTQCTFIDAAVRAGVRHIVKFSGRCCWSHSRFRFARMHAEIERHLERSGVEWTMLRPGQFMHVYFREVPTINRDGVLGLPLAKARLAPVDIEDIAKIAVEVLHGAGHGGRRYEITGPDSLGMTEVAAILTEVLGAPVRYEDVDPQVKRRTLEAQGIPGFLLDGLDELFEERRIGDGEEGRVDLSTHERFGVTPTSFADFARRNAEVFAGRAAPSHLWASGWRPAS